jgi:hypothetical protein
MKMFTQLAVEAAKGNKEAVRCIKEMAAPPRYRPFRKTGPGGWPTLRF